MEKIPTTLPNFDDVMTEFCFNLKMVKENPKFPALSLYEYSQNKMKDETEFESRTESMIEETDVSRVKNIEAPYVVVLIL